MSSEIEKLFIHYKVDEHFIPMSDFLTASNSVKIIIDDLNKQIFGGSLRYDLVILPPEDGTLLKTVGIILLSVALTPIVQDYSLGVFKGIAESKPSDYGEEHGRALRDLAKGFLVKEVEELEKCIPSEFNLDKSFKAKTNFYLSCQKNKKINAIGFDNSNNFPIDHNQFKNHISKDKLRSLDSDFYICDVIVTSPVTEDKDYVWDFEDSITKQKISAHMRDELFKSGVLSGKYPFKTDGKNSDRLKILVEYKKQERNGEIERKETCIETVYSFNDMEITSIPSDLPINTKFQKEPDLPLFGGIL